MAGSTTNLDLISASQASKEVTANSIFDAASPATLYGRRASTTSALTWGYYGGGIISGGVLTAIANGTVALTASATNYVQATLDGVVSVNTTSFTPGQIPLYTIITGASTITSYLDQRALLFASAISSQTGTGSTFVMSVAPTISGVVSIPNTLLTTGDSVTTGDTINVNLTAIGSYTASKSANTVTATAGTFSAADVNRILVWAVGTTLVYDRIATYISPTQVTVDHSGTISSQAATTYGPPMLYADNVNNIASIGKVNVTVPANGATLTISDGKTLTASNSITLSGTDGSTLNIGTGGTLGTAAFVADSGLVHLSGTETISGAKTFSSGINGTPIGATTPSTGAFSSLSASGRILQGGITDDGVTGIQTTGIRSTGKASFLYSASHEWSTFSLPAGSYADILYLPAGSFGAVIVGELQVFSTLSGAQTISTYSVSVQGEGSDRGISLLSSGDYATPAPFSVVDRGNVLGGGSRVISIYNSSGSSENIDITFAARKFNSASYYATPTVIAGVPAGTTAMYGAPYRSGQFYSITSGSWISTGGYTVAGLAGITAVIGMRTYVTDATAPTWLGTLTGGGTVKCPVFFNGTAWVAG